MRSLSRVYRLVGLMALAVTVLPGETVQGQEKKNRGSAKGITFKSFDGVELSGTFYTGGQKEAVVLLLHNFDLKKGGSSTQDGWGDLAAGLQRRGYAVLAFDFRGFGNSTRLADKDRFWQMSHNGSGLIKRRGGKTPESIDYKDFHPGYLPYLANDIAAAKAYLDRRNDAKEVNTSNLIVIGAGEGATLGAMWLAHECRRRKDKSEFMTIVPTKLGDPESKDVAGAVWLSISPKLGPRSVSLSRWLGEAGGRSGKIPMCFLFGQKDAQGDNLARSLLKHIKPDKKAETEMKNTVVKAVDGTKLVGSQLLDRDLETGKLIEQYLDHIMEARGNKEWAERKVVNSRYFYVNPYTRGTKLNKPPGEEVPSVDVNQFLGR